MNLSSTHGRQVTRSINPPRLSRHSILHTLRNTTYHSRPQKTIRITLKKISNRSRTTPRARTHRRRLRLLKYNILHLIGSSRHIIRHTPPRMNRQNSLSSTLLSRNITLLRIHRIRRHIVRQPSVKIRLLLGHTKGMTRQLSHLRSKATRSSTSRLVALRNNRNRHRNRMNLTHSNQARHGHRHITSRNLRMTTLTHNLKAGNPTTMHRRSLVKRLHLKNGTHTELLRRRIGINSKKHISTKSRLSRTQRRHSSTIYLHHLPHSTSLITASNSQNVNKHLSSPGRQIYKTRRPHRIGQI